MIRRALTSLLEEDVGLRASAWAPGERFVRELERRRGSIAGRIFATSRLSPADVALHLAACDLLLQPYPDGVTARRTSVMAGFVNGRPDAMDILQCNNDPFVGRDVDAGDAGHSQSLLLPAGSKRPAIVLTRAVRKR